MLSKCSAFCCSAGGVSQNPPHILASRLKVCQLFPVTWLVRFSASPGKTATEQFYSATIHYMPPDSVGWRRCQSGSSERMLLKSCIPYDKETHQPTSFLLKNSRFTMEMMSHFTTFAISISNSAVFINVGYETLQCACRRNLRQEF